MNCLCVNEHSVALHSETHPIYLAYIYCDLMMALKWPYWKCISMNHAALLCLFGFTLSLETLIVSRTSIIFLPAEVFPFFFYSCFSICPSGTMLSWEEETSIIITKLLTERRLCVEFRGPVNRTESMCGALGNGMRYRLIKHANTHFTARKWRCVCVCIVCV